MFPKPTAVELILDANTSGKALLKNTTIDISVAHVLRLVNSTNRQTLELMNNVVSATSEEGIRVKAVASASFEIGTFVGTVGGTTRGLTIGTYDRATPTVITKWMTFTGTTGEVNCWGTIFQVRRYANDATAVQYIAKKYRGTETIPTEVLASDSLLLIVAQGYNGSAISTGASIQFQAAADFASGSLPTRIIFNTCATGSSVNTARMSITEAGIVQVNRLIGQAAEVTVTPGATTATMTLDSGRMQTLTLVSTTGNTTATLTVPTIPADGSILVKQHGTTPRNITWAVSSGTIKWMGTQPTWNADAVNAVRNVRWRWDGSVMHLESSAAG